MTAVQRVTGFPRIKRKKTNSQLVTRAVNFNTHHKIDECPTEKIFYTRTFKSKSKATQIL